MATDPLDFWSLCNLRQMPAGRFLPKLTLHSSFSVAPKDFWKFGETRGLRLLPAPRLPVFLAPAAGLRLPKPQPACVAPLRDFDPGWDVIDQTFAEKRGQQLLQERMPLRFLAAVAGPPPPERRLERMLSAAAESCAVLTLATRWRARRLGQQRLTKRLPQRSHAVAVGQPQPGHPSQWSRTNVGSLAAIPQRALGRCLPATDQKQLGELEEPSTHVDSQGWEQQ